MKRLAWALLLGMAALVQPGHAREYQLGSILIDQPWGLVSEHSESASGYMTITNLGDVEDLLLTVTSAVAEQAELQEPQGDGSAAARARTIDAGIAIPSGGTVTLQPGTFHVRLLGLDAAATLGDSFPLTLTFEASGTVEVQVEIRSIEGGENGSTPGN